MGDIMDKASNELMEIISKYSNNYGENLGINQKKCTLTPENKVNVIKKIKKR